VLLPVLLAALRALGDAPARSLTVLAQRLGVSEADAATVVTPQAEEATPIAAAPAAAPMSPLLPMTAPNDASSAPKTLLHRRTVIAARKRTISHSRGRRMLLKINDLFHSAFVNIKPIESTTYAFCAVRNATVLN